jgi:hypothetical protein
MASDRTRGPGVPAGSLTFFRMRSRPLPQVARNKISTHTEHPDDQDLRVKDPQDQLILK